MYRKLLLAAVLALPMTAFAQENMNAAEQEATGSAAATETQPEEAAAPSQESVQEPTEAPAQDSQPATQDE